MCSKSVTFEYMNDVLNVLIFFFFLFLGFFFVCVFFFVFFFFFDANKVVKGELHRSVIFACKIKLLGLL